MTGDELRRIRTKLGLSLEQMGRAFGHAGTRQTVKTTIHRYETGERPVPPAIGQLALMFDRFGVPRKFLETHD